MDLIALYLAARAGRDEARSALPDAPAVPDPPPAPAPSTVAIRRVMARSLRRAADRIEPGIACG